MGISTDAKLIWGLPGEELRDELPQRVRDLIDSEGYYEALAEDGLNLDHASPWFDCDYYECIWGVDIAVDADNVDVSALPGLISAAAETFKQKTGLEGRLFVSAHVT